MSGAKLKEGVYRGVLLLDPKDNIELPFNFDVIYLKKKPQIIIRNGDEKIVVTEITKRKDSLIIKMPVFDTEFRCVMKGDSLEGVWINHYRKEKNIIPFHAVYGESRRFLSVPGKANPYFEGKWEVTFSPGLKDSSKAIGVFHHLEQTDYMTGTFITETGDYRFLEGMKSWNQLYLSCFDGSHAFLFTGKIREGSDIIDGKFYSGAHWQEGWTARRNPDFRLKDAEEITWLKNKDQVFDFTFEDLNKKKVSLSDEEFKNKPVIIQLMGSWCPNCMDETAYLTEIYNQFHSEGLEIIALAFEKTSDPEVARKQLNRLVKHFNVKYPVLLTNKTGKEKASETLSFLNQVSAFPTTIFLNRQHQVVKIHTGFSGPATGNEYLSFRQKTETLIKNLIKE